MYLMLQSGEFADGDLNALAELLGLLDTKLKDISDRIKHSNDPDADGLFDRGEYFIGVGFAAVQQYIVSTFTPLGVQKDVALSVPPIARGKTTLVHAINAGANYWKHQDEWRLVHVVFRDIDELGKSAKLTVQTIETITPWTDYTCSNLLAALLPQEPLELSLLLEKLKEWRSNLHNSYAK